MLPQLLKDLCIPIEAVYPFPDGNLCYEWQLPNEVIARIEVISETEYELMISYPLNADGSRTKPTFAIKKD